MEAIDDDSFKRALMRPGLTWVLLSPRFQLAKNKNKQLKSPESDV